jgi:hypothetical protein
MTLAGAAWWVVVGLHLGSWLWGVVLAGMVWALSKAVLGIRGKRPDPPAVLEAGLFLWWAFSFLSAVLFPGWSYLFLWPLLIMMGGTALAHFGPNGPSNAIRRELVAMAVGSAMILILLPVAVDFFHLAQPRPGNPDSQAIPLIILPAFFLALFLGVVGPLRRDELRPPGLVGADRNRADGLPETP